MQVLFIDLVLCNISVLISFLIIFNFIIPPGEIDDLLLTITATMLVKLFFFNIFRPYSGIIRFTSTEDAKRIVKSIGWSSAFLIFINLGYYYMQTKTMLHFSVLILDFVFSVFMMASFRIISKITYFEYRQQNAKKKNVIIYGAGEAGVITKRTLTQYSNYASSSSIFR